MVGCLREIHFPLAIAVQVRKIRLRNRIKELRFAAPVRKMLPHLPLVHLQNHILILRQADEPSLHGIPVIDVEPADGLSRVALQNLRLRKRRCLGKAFRQELTVAEDESADQPINSILTVLIRGMHIPLRQNGVERHEKTHVIFFECIFFPRNKIVGIKIPGGGHVLHEQLRKIIPVQILEAKMPDILLHIHRLPSLDDTQRIGEIKNNLHPRIAGKRNLRIVRLIREIRERDV